MEKRLFEGYEDGRAIDLTTHAYTNTLLYVIAERSSGKLEYHSAILGPAVSTPLPYLFRQDVELRRALRSFVARDKILITFICCLNHRFPRDIVLEIFSHVNLAPTPILHNCSYMGN
jgi:hypothetical protein